MTTQISPDIVQLLERLRNPMWVHGNVPFLSPQLDKEENLAAMNDAADEIERLIENCVNAVTRAWTGNDFALRDQVVEAIRAGTGVAQSPDAYRKAIEWIASVEEPFLESTAYLMWHKARDTLEMPPVSSTTQRDPVLYDERFPSAAAVTSNHHAKD